MLLFFLNLNVFGFRASEGDHSFQHMLEKYYNKKKVHFVGTYVLSSNLVNGCKPTQVITGKMSMQVSQ